MPWLDHASRLCRHRKEKRRQHLFSHWFSSAAWHWAWVQPGSWCLEPAPSRPWWPQRGEVTLHWFLTLTSSSRIPLQSTITPSNSYIYSKLRWKKTNSLYIWKFDWKPKREWSLTSLCHVNVPLKTVWWSKRPRSVSVPDPEHSPVRVACNDCSCDKWRCPEVRRSLILVIFNVLLSDLSKHTGAVETNIRKVWSFTIMEKAPTRAY